MNIEELARQAGAVRHIGSTPNWTIDTSDLERFAALVLEQAALKCVTARMTLKDFATMAGVTVERCDKKWGGTWAYKTTDNPRCAYCGYHTENALYRAWAENTFGKAASKALVKLLSA